ncbi:MAG: glycosyltransferase family 2 protein [Ginsengibacter sp.]
MKKFLPYNIVHIDLNELEDPVVPEKYLTGNYIVIWLKEIALGQFFLEPDVIMDGKEFKNKIASEIIKTIEHYEKEITYDFADRKTWLFNHSIAKWQIRLDNIFGGEMSKDLPPTVPISVIVCTQNRPDFLEQCLSFLQNSVCKPAEIIVVDNGSQNVETYNLVTQFENVTYVKEQRQGLSIARNSGIKKASSSIVAFTDDDVKVHPLWTYRIWEVFQQDNITATTGLVIASQLETEAQYIFEKNWSFNRGFVEKMYETEYFEKTLRNGPPVWEIGAGANMAFKKAVFEEVGYFNECLGAGASGCSEDSEMWFRILAHGHNIRYTPKAIVFHQHRKDLQSLKNQIFNYMQGFTVAALLQQKQFPRAAYKRHIFMNLPRYYFSLIRKGFPFYRAKFQTLPSEMKGVISGLRYYYKNLHKLMHSLRK